MTYMPASARAARTSGFPASMRGGVHRRRALASACLALASGVALAQMPERGLVVPRSPAVAVLLSHHTETTRERGLTLALRQDLRRLERDLTECLGRELHASRGDLRVLAGDEFRRTAFPDLEREQAPHSVESLLILAQSETFLARVAPLGLRFLVVVGGSSEEDLRHGGMACMPVGVVPAGCFGSYVWDRRSRLGAVVVDLHARTASGAADATAAGIARRGAAGPIPIWSVPDTQAEACRDLGIRVAADIAARSSIDPLAPGASR